MMEEQLQRWNAKLLLGIMFAGNCMEMRKKLTGMCSICLNLDGLYRIGVNATIVML